MCDIKCIYEIAKYNNCSSEIKHLTRVEYIAYIMCYNVPHEIFHALYRTIVGSNDTAESIFDEEMNANLFAALFWKKFGSNEFLSEIIKINKKSVDKYCDIYQSFKKYENGKIIPQIDIYEAFKGCCEMNFIGGIYFSYGVGACDVRELDRRYSAFQAWSIQQALLCEGDFNEFAKQKKVITNSICAQQLDFALEENVTPKVINTIETLFNESGNFFPKIWLKYGEGNQIKFHKMNE